jgi:hypothetical protein
VAQFIPGIELARALYEDHVAALLSGIPHAAALLGEGSEVLGFDTERSTDHAWGPRLQLFVEADAVPSVESKLDQGLPDEVGGWAVRFYRWQVDAVTHHVEVWTLENWLAKRLGYDPRDGMPNARWLAAPQQSLLHVTAGAVFNDETGELKSVREQLSWYPKDVWLWIMTSAWQRVQDTEPMVGRTAEIGDEVGNRLVIAKLIDHLMSLCFLQERCYAPYQKWRARAFMRLEGAKEVAPKFGRALSAEGPDARIEAVAESLEDVGRRHNELGLTKSLDYRTGPFDVKINDAVRPFRVLNANRFVRACFEAIEDEGLRNLDAVGSLDQLLDANDLVTNFTDWPRKLEEIFSGKLRNP